MKRSETKPDKSLFVFEAYEDKEEATDTKRVKKPDSFWKGSFKRLMKNKGAMVSLVLLVIITVISLLGPFMNDFHYVEQDVSRTHLLPLVHVLEWAGLEDRKSTRLNSSH